MFLTRCKWIIPLVMAIGWLSGPAIAQEIRPGEAVFDWFEYRGRDSVYTIFTPGPDEYLNPVLAGFYPDPSLCRVGNDYYLVNSSFSFYPGIPIFHSTDLVHWTQIGHVLDRPSQLKLDGLPISFGVFAPTIRYHEGTFYVVNTLVGGGGNFIVTATDPKGPWSDPIWLPEVDGIDPSIFFDDDGKAYITNNGPPDGPSLYEGHRAIWIQEYDLKAQKMVGLRKVIVDGGVDIDKKPIWIEGPHQFEVDGWIYLIAAEGGTAEDHSEVVFRSRSVFGPYEPYAGNPILTQRHLSADRTFPVTSTGHADFVQTPDGDWWAVFLGCRPYRDNLYNTGRETFMLPVRWVDGWPVILAENVTVPYRHKRPDLAAGAPPAAPHSGNFTVRDEFNGPSLALYWNLIRTPHETWYDLAAHPGSLTLRARNQDIGKAEQPSFVGRRQQHARCTVQTALRFVPRRDGDRAGLVAFQNDDYYYFVGLARENGRPVVRLEMRAGKTAGDAPRVLASAPLESAPENRLYLRIEADGDRYGFYYALTPDDWKPLEPAADGTLLSTKTAGGFVGAYFGMYAFAP